MKPMTIKQIVKVVNGNLIGKNISEEKILGISTDTRENLEGKLFVPLVGENFNGHDYINLAFEKGALIILSEKFLDIKKTYIKVESTKQSLMDIGEYYKTLFKIKSIAVTGSSGKTTTKDIINSVLSTKFKTLKTKGNLNNEIGLPKTIFNISDKDEVGIFEIGMNHFGEINNLSKIIKPDIAVITNIGTSHIEYLGSREGILKAKSEVFNFMDNESIKILNGDDEMLKTLKDKEKNIIFYGLNKTENNFYADNIIYKGIFGSSFNINYLENKIQINLNKPGQHMIYNSLSAAAVGYFLGLNFDEIKIGLENLEVTKMRMEILETKNFIIINDVYNANPESMKAGINVLKEEKGRLVGILGDMLELGENSSTMHFDLGKYIGEENINILISIGKESYNMYQGFLQNKNNNQEGFYFETKEEALKNIRNILKQNDIILIKASRGMKFEEITNKLKEL